ncbi:GNAT family N-acetyltransferase [Schleiferilactobacillus perolens]|uniref:Acetyltransferase, GNAT family n=1 Tax=Schleiferilactobacillus perolens DSM 12744 TaxID=1423792 RepID=A0A0R1MU76_9LACO|nr:GNAT family N-acetyltransferase [Schleiferilactobacillus perolens]KRL11097.1 acetyltransferase, GNAT family [Schleiferilactobacillus perolens DSM 12744]
MAENNQIEIRPITPADDAQMAAIVRDSLSAVGLAIPGTAYFDPELPHLSHYYAAKPGREYFVAVRNGLVLGGAGIAEYEGTKQVAELQKVYVAESARGQGLSKQLIEHALAFAWQAKYESVYLETHHKLHAAMHVYQEFGFHPLLQPLGTAEHSAMDSFWVKLL